MYNPRAGSTAKRIRRISSFGFKQNIAQKKEKRAKVRKREKERERETKQQGYHSINAFRKTNPIFALPRSTSASAIRRPISTIRIALHRKSGGGGRGRWGTQRSIEHGNGDVDAEVAVVGEELGDRRVEDEAVRVEDGRRDALVDRTRRRLPRQPPPVAAQFQPEIRETAKNKHRLHQVL